jgi:hypothetical protein
VSSEECEPLRITASGTSARSARPRRVGSTAGVSSSVRKPARRTISSSACECRASILLGAEASKIIAASVRVAGGVSRLIADNQPLA